MLAAGFHEALGTATARLAATLAGEHGLDTVALTGGVFQNVRLTEVVESALAESGLRVLAHEQIPAERRRHQHRPSGHRCLAPVSRRALRF